jgi:hypothetical protein
MLATRALDDDDQKLAFISKRVGLALATAAQRRRPVVDRAGGSLCFGNRSNSLYFGLQITKC